ncbi:MAG: hypothetical protein M3320_00610 [Actinomycetota bacterium]|nr:hypothetical protein [Actinomycetota bacterium]
MLDGPVAPELLARVRDFSPLIDTRERVERVAIATVPLTLLVMTDRYLHIVTARGTHQWADGKPRSSPAARADGEDLLVRPGPADEERRFGEVLPLGAAARLADELYKPFTVEDVRRLQRQVPSIADFVW